MLNEQCNNQVSSSYTAPSRSATAFQLCEAVAALSLNLQSSVLEVDCKWLCMEILKKPTTTKTTM